MKRRVLKAARKNCEMRNLPPADIRDIHNYSLIGLESKETRRSKLEAKEAKRLQKIENFIRLMNAQCADGEFYIQEDNTSSSDEDDDAENLFNALGGGSPGMHDSLAAILRLIHPKSSDRNDSNGKQNSSTESTSRSTPESVPADLEIGPKLTLKLLKSLERGDTEPMKNAFRQAMLKGSRPLEELHTACMGITHWHPGTQPGNRVKILAGIQIALIDAIIVELMNLPSEQTLVDVTCLLSYTEYVVDLHKRLGVLTPPTPTDPGDVRRCDTQHLVDILRTALETHNEFSEKNIRTTKEFMADRVHLQSLLSDPNTIYMKYLTYFMYEMYYRRLDYTIATIILDNLHSLKVRLDLPEKTYQNIECALYYFIYRADEDWLHYMPANRPQSTSHLFFNNEPIVNVKVRDDPHRLFNGPVIYLEWQKFRKCLADFEVVLKETDVKMHLKPEGTKLKTSEINSLTALPYLRDEHSLKKMLEYLAIVEEDEAGTSPEMMMIVQRVAQVTGELLLSHDTVHLAPTTRALLTAELPRAQLHRLTQLRNELSKTRDGKMLAKIRLESSHPDLYRALARDLIHIRNGINQVHRVYKPLVAKELVRDGLKLLHERRAEWPSEVGECKSFIEMMLIPMEGDFTLSMSMEEIYVKQYLKGYSRQLFREIVLVSLNVNNLNKELEKHCLQSINVVIEKLFNYVETIKNTLALMRADLDVWESIVRDVATLPVTVSVLTYPEKNCILDINREVKKLKTNIQTKNTVIKNLKRVTDRTDEWRDIKHLLKFFIDPVGLFRNNAREIKKSYISAEYRAIDRGFPDRDGINSVEFLLYMTIDEAKSYCENNILPVPEEVEEYQYEGIERLWESVRRASGESRRLECLCERAAALRRAVQGARTVDALRTLWASDARARLAAEAALADVHIVLAEAGLGVPARRPPGQLLAELPIRNMLQHGSVVLEEVGARLDPNDSLATLVLEVLEDEECWCELLAMHGGGIHAEVAARRMPLGVSPRWRRYLGLLRGAGPAPRDPPARLYHRPHAALFLLVTLEHVLPGALDHYLAMTLHSLWSYGCAFIEFLY